MALARQPRRQPRPASPEEREATTIVDAVAVMVSLATAVGLIALLGSL